MRGRIGYREGRCNVLTNRSRPPRAAIDQPTPSAPTPAPIPIYTSRPSQAAKINLPERLN